MIPRFKDQQIIQFAFPASGSTTFIVNNLQPVDKIRITCFDTLSMTTFQPILLLWSNLVDNYIGSVADTLSVGDYEFSRPMRVGTGTEFFFTHKKILSGEYTLRISNLVGDVPAGITDNFYVVIEYFIY